MMDNVGEEKRSRTPQVTDASDGYRRYVEESVDGDSIGSSEDLDSDDHQEERTDELPPLPNDDPEMGMPNKPSKSGMHNRRRNSNARDVETGCKGGRMHQAVVS
jgi:hypothetical protein